MSLLYNLYVWNPGRNLTLPGKDIQMEILLQLFRNYILTDRTSTDTTTTTRILLDNPPSSEANSTSTTSTYLESDPTPIITTISIDTKPRRKIFIQKLKTLTPGGRNKLLQ